MIRLGKTWGLVQPSLAEVMPILPVSSLFSDDDLDEHQPGAQLCPAVPSCADGKGMKVLPSLWRVDFPLKTMAAMDITSAWTPQLRRRNFQVLTLRQHLRYMGKPTHLVIINLKDYLLVVFGYTIFNPGMIWIDYINNFPMCSYTSHFAISNLLQVNHHLSSVQNHCWLMISWGIILPFISWGLVHNPRRGLIPINQPGFNGMIEGLTQDPLLDPPGPGWQTLCRWTRSATGSKGPSERTPGRALSRCPPSGWCQVDSSGFPPVSAKAHGSKSHGIFPAKARRGARSVVVFFQLLPGSWAYLLVDQQKTVSFLSELCWKL